MIVVGAFHESLRIRAIFPDGQGDAATAERIRCVFVRAGFTGARLASGEAAEMLAMPTITVHFFTSTEEAYDRSQTGYYLDGDEERAVSVADGDILYVPSERVVGIMVQAWPLAVTEQRGEFHRFME